MSYYSRVLQLDPFLQHRSLFLLGPRQTGKSTFLQKYYPDARYFSLLEADTFRRLQTRPELLRQSISPADHRVVIDEIQKLPELLDEVQRLLELYPQLRFILTGSSARKLKRSGVNLLAGRAWTCHMHPLVFAELGPGRLLDRLNRGSMPAVIDSPYAHEELKAYVGTYLQEEIRAESLARSIENFSRFLEVAGLTHGEIVNFTKVGSDAGVPSRTVREYYQVLQDTLVGYFLEPFRGTHKRKPVATAKFYFFDVGVANFLKRRTQLMPGSAEFGQALEHLIFLELKAYLDYRRQDRPLNFWRSQSQFEVDFVLGEKTAIEVKAKESVQNYDLKGLRALAEEVPLERKIVVCLEKEFRKTEDAIEIISAEDFLRKLWDDEF